LHRSHVYSQQLIMANAMFAHDSRAPRLIHKSSNGLGRKEIADKYYLDDTSMCHSDSRFSHDTGILNVETPEVRQGIGETNPLMTSTWGHQ